MRFHFRCTMIAILIACTGGAWPMEAAAIGYAEYYASFEATSRRTAQSREAERLRQEAAARARRRAEACESFGQTGFSWEAPEARPWIVLCGKPALSAARKKNLPSTDSPALGAGGFVPTPISAPRVD